jgi:GNAT superfamily N-acetyltransferase
MLRRRDIETHPLTPDRWRDFTTLMGSAYYTRHCWCTWPRLSTSYALRTGEANRRSIKKVVDTAKAPPGVLAYVGGEPVGWCAVAPREEYPRLAKERAIAPLDDQRAWSVVCFFIRRDMRRSGVSKALLAAAVKLAQQHGASVVEGYPVEGTRNVFRGMTSVFKGAGFEEVARRAPNRPYMRYVRGRRSA